MRKPELNEVDVARRRFLNIAKSAGAVGALAVRAGKSATVELRAERAVAAEPPASGGYRETEHIRKYYYCAGYW